MSDTVKSKQTGNAPAVSVVIPVYNGARTMPLVLEAVYRSTFRDFEVVIVHDCSTDNTREVLNGLRQRFPFRLIEFPENRGVSKARNAGAAEARGEIVLFIDADCLVLPDTIGLCVEELRRGVNIAVGGAYTKNAWDDDFFSNFQSLYIHHVETKTEHPDYLATHCMAIWKKTFLEFGGFKEDYFIGHAASVEDVELSHRLKAAGHSIGRPHGLEVQHMFGYSLSRSIKNAIKKSKYWTMYSLHNKDVTKDSGAASHELKVNVSTQSLNVVLAAAALALRMWWLFVPVGLLYSLNTGASYRLFRTIRRERGWVFLLKAMAYYQFVYPAAVAYGSFMGTLKFFWEVKLLKRYTEAEAS
ncbi:MAG: glycosyltransferase family 2 protein [Thermoleophilia bacterium]|nr:glycosyltransferase family 2 protein [Thermoleophilia bacterium]